MSFPETIPEFLEAPGGGQHPRLERSDGRVVRLHGGIEAAPQFIEVLEHRAETLVEVLPEQADLLGVRGQLLLGPAVRGGPQQREQRHRAREEHAPFDPVLEQPLVVLQRGTEEGLTRQEEHDEVGRLGHVFPVALPAELGDVRTHLRRVVAQARVPDVRVGGLDRIEVRHQRRLRVHDHAPAAGQRDDQVGAEHRGIRGNRLLDFEVAVLFHAGQFDDAPQLDFAPSATHLGRAQGLHELPRLRLEPLLPIGQARQLCRQLPAFLLPGRFHAREGLLDLLERGAHRIQHGL